MNISVKHNPYTFETQITINNRPVSSMHTGLDTKAPLSYWIDHFFEQLPKIYHNMYPEDSLYHHKIHIFFEGIAVDFTLLQSAMYRMYTWCASIQAWHLPVLEPDDKYQQIKDLHDVCTNEHSPWNKELPQNVQTAFAQVQKQELEVSVVATMSSGKSTLINALLQRKIMPTAQEACTAIITKIRDTDALRDSSPLATSFDVQGKIMQQATDLTYKDMEALNAKEDVACVEILGNIPFVTSSNTALVLIDTPGSNNTRDKNHEKIQKDFLHKSSNALLLYVITGEFGTNDDYELLSSIIKSMQTEATYASNRFFFVFNKLDSRNEEDGTVASSLESAYRYIENQGLPKPRIFPVSAKAAMLIRMLLQGDVLSENDQDFVEMLITKLNRTEELHLEKYAERFSGMPSFVCKGIANECLKVREEWEAKGGKQWKSPHEALFHTGIPTLESALRMYIEEYAKPVQIRNIVETINASLGNLLKHQGGISSYNEKINQWISDIHERITILSNMYDI